MSDDQEVTEMAAMIYRQYGEAAEDFVATMIRNSDALNPNGGDRWRQVLRALQRQRLTNGEARDGNGG